MMAATERHPKGLYVLFATEMWERFSFYTMLAMFTLYLRDTTGQGFGWTLRPGHRLYANYLMFVYASPLIGGWLADRKLGYRRSVMIGGLFFMAGHLLLSVRSIPMVYAALTCLVIGNGFFKPNVSAMVGNLYPEGSQLKDRAYNIFYMGINVGAFLAPVDRRVRAVAVSASTPPSPWRPAAWRSRSSSSGASSGTSRAPTERGTAPRAGGVSATPARAVTEPRAPPDRCGVATGRGSGPSIVIYLIVIVFWMVFHQNGSTMTYWANENTRWQVTGIISNAINPAWVILLTFPLVAFWRWLDRRRTRALDADEDGLGMFCTSLAFFVLFIAARTGEAAVTGGNIYAFRVSPGLASRRLRRPDPGRAHAVADGARAGLQGGAASATAAS